MTTLEPMSKISDLAEQILAGATRGRVVIDTHAMSVMDPGMEAAAVTHFGSVESSVLRSG